MLPEKDGAWNFPDALLTYTAPIKCKAYPEVEVVRAFSKSAPISGPQFEAQSFPISLAWRDGSSTLFNIGGALN